MNERNKSLQDQAEEIMREPVKKARISLQTEFKAMDNTLGALQIHEHGALLQMLGASYQVREMTAKNAMQEHQYQMQRQAQAVEAQKTADLEAAQNSIAEANKPKLVPVAN